MGIAITKGRDPIILIENFNKNISIIMVITKDNKKDELPDVSNKMFTCINYLTNFINYDK
jgi:hypothetical protein